MDRWLGKSAAFSLPGGTRKAMDAIHAAWRRLVALILDPLTKASLSSKLEAAEELARKGESGEARMLAEEVITTLEMGL